MHTNFKLPSSEKNFSSSLSISSASGWEGGGGERERERERGKLRKQGGTKMQPRFQADASHPTRRDRGHTHQRGLVFGLELLGQLLLRFSVELDVLDEEVDRHRRQKLVPIVFLAAAGECHKEALNDPAAFDRKLWVLAHALVPGQNIVAHEKIDDLDGWGCEFLSVNAGDGGGMNVDEGSMSVDSLLARLDQ